MTRVCAAQLSLAVGDVDGNRRAGLEAIAAAAAADAEVVVLPELSDTGYVSADRDEASALADPGPTVEGWVAAARRHGVVVVGGFCDRERDILTNSAVVVDATGPLARSRRSWSTPPWGASGSWSVTTSSFPNGSGGPPTPAPTWWPHR